MDKSEIRADPSPTGILRYAPAAVLRIEGEDALTFLQGQFTQELRPAAAAPVTYGLWLNQKGRVLADSHVVRVSPQELWLFSLESPAATLRERLEAYIIADDVTVEDVTADWRGYLLVGQRARGGVTGEEGLPPLAAGSFKRPDGGFAFNGDARRGLGDSLELFLPLHPPPAIPELDTISPEEVERARILAGLAAVPRDVGPGDLPNEGGLEEVAISYTKGCYLGQEVIARLKAMGRVRRRLHRVAASSGPVPRVPASLLQGGKKTGELRSVVADTEGGWVGLAMMSLLSLDPSAPLALEGEAEATVALRSGEGPR